MYFFIFIVSSSFILIFGNFIFNLKILSPMAKIRELYGRDISTLKEELEQYIRNTKDFADEIEEFKLILADQSHEKALFIFYVELLAKAIKKPVDANNFISALLCHIDTSNNIRNSIINLRCFRALFTMRFFIPISFYIIKLMKEAMNIKNLKKISKKFDYDHIRISSDEENSEELQMFLIRECLILIKSHAHMFGNSIGFPEFATVLCNELRTHCKVGIFRDLTSELIKFIGQRKTYIEEQRNKFKIDAMNTNNVKEFENNLDKWAIDQ